MNVPQVQSNFSERDIVSLVENVKVMNPDVGDRLTNAAVVAYLKLPDTSFGWSEKAGEPMPAAAKLLSVATHLRYNLPPGMGFFFYLGSNLYASVKASRTKALEDPNWIYKSVKWIPHTKEEREALHLDPKDYSIKMVATVIKDGVDLEVEGDGIIDEKELRSSKFQYFSKKAVIQTLKTRAEGEILKRFYPLGIPVDDPEPEPIRVTGSDVSREDRLQTWHDTHSLPASDGGQTNETNETVDKDLLARYQKLVDKIGVKKCAELLNTDDLDSLISNNRDLTNAFDVLFDFDIENPTTPPKPSKSKRGGKARTTRRSKETTPEPEHAKTNPTPPEPETGSPPPPPQAGEPLPEDAPDWIRDGSGDPEEASVISDRANQSTGGQQVSSDERGDAWEPPAESGKPVENSKQPGPLSREGVELANKSTQLVDRLLVRPGNSPTVKKTLEELRRVTLINGDYTGLPQFVRLANAGNPRGLIDLAGRYGIEVR